jgi:hypothetical protein
VRLLARYGLVSLFTVALVAVVLGLGHPPPTRPAAGHMAATHRHGATDTALDTSPPPASWQAAEALWLGAIGYIALEEADWLASIPPPTPPASTVETTSGSTTRQPSGGSASPGGAWACIRQHESGGNYSSPGGGAYQFLDSTWHSLGYSGSAQDYPPAVQDAAAIALQARSGWGQWTTAAMCGLR